MRTKALTLAVAALLALGASGGVTASTATPVADTASADALPSDHTVDVLTPAAVSDAAVDQAIETAWANDTVQSYFDDGAAVHFQVWTSELDEDVVHVNVAPRDSPDETRVVAHVTLGENTVTSVTSVDEPVKLTASNSISIDATDYELQNADPERQDNETRDDTAQASQFSVDEDSMERGGDGTFSFTLENEDGLFTDVSAGDILRIAL
ncbi:MULTISPECIES: hypothetical protein [Salinibaculum]|uniref:hypothetical protein n=1 Tax=Salinibaculum TaxID=2732368 RepID=UPI0030D04A41